MNVITASDIGRARSGKTQGGEEEQFQALLRLRGDGSGSAEPDRLMLRARPKRYSVPIEAAHAIFRP